MRRRARYGSYDKSFEDELDMVPVEEGITHLYNTRGIVDKWLGHPTLDSIFPGSTFSLLLKGLDKHSLLHPVCLGLCSTTRRFTKITGRLGGLESVMNCIASILMLG